MDRDRGAWWAAVHGVARSRTQLSDFTFIFHSHALEKEMAAHSSILAWRISGPEEPGGLLSMGSHRVGYDWSDLAAAAAAIALQELGIFPPLAWDHTLQTNTLTWRTTPPPRRSGVVPSGHRYWELPRANSWDLAPWSPLFWGEWPRLALIQDPSLSHSPFD